jgi:lambda family phage tail tape measure protein
MTDQNIKLTISAQDNTQQTIQSTGKSLDYLGGTLTKLSVQITAFQGAWNSAMMVFQKGMQYAELGAKAQQAEESFRLVAASAGASADGILAAMKRASAGTVDDSDIMQKAVKGMIQDIPADQLSKIMDGARISARVAGVDVGEAFASITDAIANQMPRSLRQFGLISKEQMTIFNNAVAEGVDSVKLLDFVMENMELQAAKMGNPLKNAAEQLQIFKAQAKDTGETIGKFLLSVLQGLYGEVQWLVSGFMGMASAITYIQSAIYSASAYMHEKVGDKAGAEALRATAGELSDRADVLYGAADELNKKGSSNVTGVTSTSQTDVVSNQNKKRTADEIAEDNKRKDAAAAALVARAQAAKLAVEAMKVIDKDYFETQAQNIQHNSEMAKLASQNDLITAQTTLDAKTGLDQQYYTRTKAEIFAEEAARSDTDKKKISGAIFTSGKLQALDAEMAKRKQEAANTQIELNAKIDLSNRAALNSYAAWDQDTQDKLTENTRNGYGKRFAITAEQYDKIRDYERMTGQETTNDEKQTIDEIMAIYQTTFVGGWKTGLLEISDEFTNIGKNMTDATKKIFGTITDALTEFLTTGSTSFTDLANSIIKDLIRVQIQANITGPLAGLLSGSSGWSIDWGELGSMISGSAKGNVFEYARVVPYANGGIVNRPTLFPMANGAGLMGEAGPEGIFPLRRNSRGELGVVGSGQSQPVNITVQLDNKSGTELKTTSSQTKFNGQAYIVNVVVDAVSRNAGGAKTNLQAALFGVA